MEKVSGYFFRKTNWFQKKKVLILSREREDFRFFRKKKLRYFMGKSFKIRKKKAAQRRKQKKSRKER